MKKGGCDADWDGHNPYFNRWFSAIKYFFVNVGNSVASQSLF